MLNTQDFADGCERKLEHRLKGLTMIVVSEVELLDEEISHYFWNRHPFPPGLQYAIH